MNARTITTAILLFLNLAVYGQQVNVVRIEKLKSEATRIEKEIQIRTDSLNEIKKEIKHIENQEFLSKHLKQNGELSITAVLRFDGKLRKSNNSLSDVITTVQKGDTVKLTDYQDGYWIINKGQFFGYLSEVFIISTNEVKIFKDELQRQNEEYEKELREKKEKEEAERIKLAHDKRVAIENQYRQKIIDKYGESIGRKLLDGYYWIGMTDEMALVSLGRPRNVNRAVGSWGVHEQWVYNNLYLYFENGELTSYQNSR